MAAITIGAGAINRSTSFISGFTTIQNGDAANDTGTLTSMSFWFNTNAGGVKAGTFYGSGTSYQDRDFETIGSVTSGSKQTFTGLDCDVQTGDFIGLYYSSGSIEIDASGGNGNFAKSGDFFGTGSNSYTSLSNRAISIEGLGATVTTGKNWNGITISKWNGVTVSKINGI